ncbi:hypothetical protein [Frankia sp. AgB32]|uniref:hypothetical protein n=1 Tax=Frankia sp. AgB32 TaxID=631119 RepID=UPI00200DF79B|nr:hypothetical protein [Frankia sp. AgB32]MCK9893269.1 hypothetical protein [Frankia sp. AgB32]
MATFFAYLFLAPLTAVFFGFLIWLFPAMLLRDRMSQFRIRPFAFFVTGYVFTVVQAIYLLVSRVWIAPIAGTVASLGLVWVARDQWRRRRPAGAGKLFRARRGTGQPSPADPNAAPGQQQPPWGYQGQPPAPGHPVPPGHPYYGPPVPPGAPQPPGYPQWSGNPPPPGQPGPAQSWSGQSWPGQPSQGPQPGQQGPQGSSPAPGWAGGKPWYPQPGPGGADGGQPPAATPRPGQGGVPAVDRPGPTPTPAGRPGGSWPPPPGPPSQPPADDSHPELPQLDEPLLIPDYPPNFDDLPAPPMPERRPRPAGSPHRDGRDVPADAGDGADAGTLPGTTTPAADDGRGASTGPGAGPDVPPPSGRGPGRRAAGYPWAAPPPGEPPNPGPEPPDPDDRPLT